MQVTKCLRTIFILVVAAVPLSVSLAQESEYGGPPEPKQILGYWKLVPFVKPELNEVNPWPLEYQWFAFFPNGRMASMMKTEDKNFTKAQLVEIFDEAKETAPKYRAQENWLIVEYSDKSEAYELWGMNLFKVDTRVTKKGDLIMSLASPEDSRPIYYRHLRPVQ